MQQHIKTDISVIVCFSYYVILFGAAHKCRLSSDYRFDSDPSSLRNHQQLPKCSYKVNFLAFFQFVFSRFIFGWFLHLYAYLFFMQVVKLLNSNLQLGKIAIFSIFVSHYFLHISLELEITNTKRFFVWVWNVQSVQVTIKSVFMTNAHMICMILCLSWTWAAVNYFCHILPFPNVKRELHC